MAFITDILFGERKRKRALADFRRLLEHVRAWRDARERGEDDPAAAIGMGVRLQAHAKLFASCDGDHESIERMTNFIIAALETAPSFAMAMRIIKTRSADPFVVGMKTDLRSEGTGEATGTVGFAERRNAPEGERLDGDDR